MYMYTGVLYTSLSADWRVVGQSAGWLIEWLAGRLADWLVGDARASVGDLCWRERKSPTNRKMY